MELWAFVFCIANGEPNVGWLEDTENELDVDVTVFDDVTDGCAGLPNWKVLDGVAVGFDPKVNGDVDGVPKLNCDFTVESAFFSLTDAPSFGVLQQAHSLSVWLFCAMHVEHDHFAVCCETILLKVSSTSGAGVAVVDDCAAVVMAVVGALLVVDVVVGRVPNVGAFDADCDEKNDVESTAGLAPPNANVPRGTEGFAPVVGLPNEKFGAAAVGAVAVEVAALSDLKLPNVIGLAVDLTVSSGLTAPNENCEVAAIGAVGSESATGFAPNENFPLGAPKSMPPLPKENADFAGVALLAELADGVSLSLAC